MSAGGLVPVLAFADRAGLRVLVEERLTVPTDQGARAGSKVAALVAGMVAGADSIEGLTQVDPVHVTGWRYGSWLEKNYDRYGGWETGQSEYPCTLTRDFRILEVTNFHRRGCSSGSANCTPSLVTRSPGRDRLPARPS